MKIRGISLIVLIITIIVIIILSTSVIISLNRINIIGQANQAKLMNDLSIFKEQVEYFKMQKLLSNPSFDANSLYARRGKIVYNTKVGEEEIDIKDIIPNLPDEYYNKLEITKGEFLINTKNEEEAKACINLGIKVNPYDVVEGELISTNSNLLSVNNDGTLKLPDNIEKIGEAAFSNNNVVKKVIIPGNVKVIGLRAFANNTVVEEVILEEGIESIESEAFKACSKLKRIKFPNSLNYIGNLAFYCCSNLDNLEIPKGVSEINSYTFCECYNLKNVKLLEGLSKIHSRAFKLTKIPEIKIPSTIDEISEVAFEDSSLEKINLEENNNFVFENSILMTSDKSKIIYVSSNAVKNTDTFVIPEGIKDFKTSIYNYSNIKKIVIPYTLENFHAENFPKNIEKVEIINKKGEVPHFIIENDIVYSADKKDLIMCYSKSKDINIVDHIDKIRSYSFMQANNLENISIKDCSYIEDQVFSYCNNLKKIMLGDRVLNINPIFKYSNYGTIEFDINNPNYISENGAIYSKDKKTLIRIFQDIKGKYVIDKNVEVIGDMAFHNRGNINEIILPEKIKVINKSFNYCDGIKKMKIPSTVEKISNNAFSNSTNLSEIIIDKEKDSIPGAPWGCENGLRAIIWKK